MAEPNLQEPPCRYGLRYVSLLLPVSVNVPNALPSADYRVIDPRYGTLEDWDNLLNGVHERKMKLMSVLIYRFRATYMNSVNRMDLVVNHTSDEVRMPTFIA